jgi:hypothetical protein
MRFAVQLTLMAAIDINTATGNNRTYSSIKKKKISE